MFNKEEFSFYASGPGLLLDQSIQIKSTHGYESGGTLDDDYYRRMVRTIQDNSLTVCSDIDKTVCLITTQHEEEERGYSLNVVLCFKGRLRDLFLNHPYSFFDMYKDLLISNQEEFREEYQTNGFEKFIEFKYDTYEKETKKYKNADLLAVCTLTALGLGNQKKNTYFLDVSEKAFCASFMHLPMFLRHKVSFSCPCYENEEALADCIIGPPEKRTCIQIKADSESILVCDETAFSQDVFEIGRALHSEKSDFSKYDGYSYEECLQHLYDEFCPNDNNSLNKESDDEGSTPNKSGDKSASPSSNKIKGYQKGHNKSHTSWTVSELEQFDKVLFVGMPLLIMILSLILYGLHNMSFYPGQGIVIQLKILGFINLFTLLLFFAACISIALFAFRKDKENNDRSESGDEDKDIENNSTVDSPDCKE